MRLLDGVDDSTGATFTLVDTTRRPDRFSYTIFIWGTWDSATAKLQASPDGTQWFDVSAASWTADAITNIELYAPYVRGVVSGSTTAATIYMELY